MSHHDAVGPDDRIVWLKISFDISQRSQELAWMFEENNHDIYQRKGANSGSVAVNQSAVMRIQVTGYQQNNPFRLYKIIQAGMVTVPHINPHKKSPKDRIFRYPPSPFKGQKYAMHLFENFSPPNPCGVSQWLPSKALRINTKGMWELYMYLTVRIYPKDHALSHLRIFRFDPELEVNNGSQDD
ncbi:hypothetical protein [Chitinimonas lacunae]|uniref:Inclusion body protein n=1 Tax=Chitinimonas lacunae TaxID=1963018 RepID=A0ABV8MV19_9NEIS